MSEDVGHDGDWYTTISVEAERNLLFGDYADWSDIVEHGYYPQVGTSWVQLTK
ncbi:hypothetical protein LV457_16845 [Mycobacterium sp. MYCO198283]|uniref:hypothetical protein n=1 Tax=Mycobacterium sp. MYCO198283 TaxID=2883505 RepID=UPI001E4278B3|nr:hypothetical protein [Mycobacterium sp. MYCO198283]MCG5433944.1 hypothetical protein [Mycobacterium sp. MYCO198283]